MPRISPMAWKSASHGSPPPKDVVRAWVSADPAQRR